MTVNYDINKFMSRNRHNFPKAFDMTTLTQEDLSKVYHLEFKSPIVAWWLQLLFCGIGAGRLYVGDWKIGLAQAALTLFLGIGILWVLIDLFQIRSYTREQNMRKLEMAVNGVSKVPTFGINMNIHNQ